VSTQLPHSHTPPPERPPPPFGPPLHPCSHVCITDSELGQRQLATVPLLRSVTNAILHGVAARHDLRIVASGRESATLIHHTIFSPARPARAVLLFFLFFLILVPSFLLFTFAATIARRRTISLPRGSAWAYACLGSCFGGLIVMVLTHRRGSGFSARSVACFWRAYVLTPPLG